MAGVLVARVGHGVFQVAIVERNGSELISYGQPLMRRGYYA
jgi:hypothetical protein